MTETQKSQLLYLLDIVIDEVKTRPSIVDPIITAHNVIKDIMSEEEIDHRAAHYEPEYAQ